MEGREVSPDHQIKNNLIKIGIKSLKNRKKIKKRLTLGLKLYRIATNKSTKRF